MTWSFGRVAAGMLFVSGLCAVPGGCGTAPGGGATTGTRDRGPVFVGGTCVAARSCVVASDDDAGGDPQDADAGPSDDAGAITTPFGDDVLPPFDDATDAHVRDLVARGRARGNNLDVMSKIGDSISESQSFLGDCGSGWYMLGAYASLAPAIEYWSRHVLSDGRNSLNRQSLCAVAGWASANALEGGADSALEHELDAAQPEWAIVMYGTNDLERVDVGTYRANMGRVLDAIEAHDAVPILSTIPDRGDSDAFEALVPMFNDAIRALAHERHEPLIDLWAALHPLPNQGLGADGVHPSSYATGGETQDCYFTEDAITYGYNVRNATALGMLRRAQGYAGM